MTEIEELQKNKIGILGFGQEGQAVLKYLAKHGLAATIFDQHETVVPSELQASVVEVVSGENYLDSIAQCTLLFRSPGIWRKHPQILNAEQQGSIITSQTKWFFEHCPAKIVGVTGTKGKGTTSSLIYEILKASGKTEGQDIFLTGNIGKIQPLEFLDNLTTENIAVYELSSFQLQDLTQSPQIGICLMTTSDHLNHHEDLGEYHSAKSSITAFQTSEDIAIYNADYEASAKIGKEGAGQKLVVSAKTKPQAGAYISGDTLLLSSGKEIDCSNRKLRGQHNMENIAAAALAGEALGIDAETISEAVNNFAGLEHRLQFAGEFNDVAYYNDSISTVPDTTIAAINSFDKPIHLLLGGSDKGLSYEDMVKEILQKDNIASITFLGEIGGNIKSLFEAANTSIPLLGPYEDLSLAINEIKERAQAGEIVLLSPASASFDMFKNYAERGRKFVELVSS